MSFKHYRSAKKQETREIMLSYLQNKVCKTAPKIVSLPAKEFIFESMVLKQYPNAEIDCFENNHAIYSTAKKKKPKNVSLQNTDVFDAISINDKTYDMVWLDLCGCICPANLVNLAVSAQSNIDGVFAFTIQINRESKFKELIRIFECKSPDDFRYRFLPGYIVKMARVVHPNFHLEEIHKYKSDKTSAPMCLYVFSTK